MKGEPKPERREDGYTVESHTKKEREGGTSSGEKRNCDGAGEG